jgi:GTP:adenosylcobinamide-phosphate guanylyltransferase
LGVDHLKGVVMAGGLASRFGRRVEKATLEVGGVALLERAVAALDLGEIDSISVSATAVTPETAELARKMGIEVLMTSGGGYHTDVLELLHNMDQFVSLNVDVPFATKDHVRLLMSSPRARSVAAVVPAELCPVEADSESVLRGSAGERMIWAGLNIVSDDPETDLLVIRDGLLCVNVNDDEDLALANRIAAERGL